MTSEPNINENDTLLVFQLSQKDTTLLYEVKPVVPPVQDCPSEHDYILSYVPIAIYLGFFVFFFLYFLRVKGFKQVFYEKSLLKAGGVGARDAEGQPIPPDQLSQSRLILFMAGISCSLIAVCMCSYVIYQGVHGQKIEGLDSLESLVTAVGLGGGLPYIANKLSSAWSDKKNQDTTP